jgi:transcriptional regulator with XRE-family HTH domain
MALIIMADRMWTVEQLCAERGLDARQLAERSGVDELRVVAIIHGRWTPSPGDRDRIAAALGLTRDRIMWDHKVPVQHLYGQGPA